MTLENLFNGLNNQLTEIMIHNGKQFGHDEQVNGGEQIRRGIEYAQSCYEEHLHLPLDQLERTVRDVYDRLNTLAQGVINNQRDVIQTLRRDVQEVINRIFQSSVIARRVPQLITTSPHLVLANAQPIHFIFQGNFPQGENPTLTFGDARFQPVITHVNQLTFDVPKNVVFQAVEHPQSINVSSQGILRIPFVPIQARDPRNRYAVTYKIFVRSFPTSTGPIIWGWHTTHLCQESRPQPFFLSPTIPPGLIPTLQFFNQQQRSGLGSTIEHRWSETKQGSERITMLWGEARVFAIPNTCNPFCQAGRCISSWRIFYVDIYGNHFEYDFSSSHTFTPYLTVQGQQSSVTLKTPKVNQLPEFV